MAEENSNNVNDNALALDSVSDEEMILHTYHMIMRLVNEYELSSEIEQINIAVNGDLDSICFDVMQTDDIDKFYANVFKLFDFLSDIVFPDHMYISIERKINGIDISSVEVIMERRPDWVAEFVTGCGRRIRSFEIEH
jgi:hypothetical protein